MSRIEIFSTCPSSATADRAGYVRSVIDVARWSERAGCTGILVYTDNGLIDPWLVAQVVIENTDRLCPLVAVQPMYMHPYSVAKMVTSFAYLYRRRIHLNMVAGGFRNDLIALNDVTPHDQRYDRLIEYTQIVKRLLEDQAPVTFQGGFYSVAKLTLRPPMPANLLPRIFVSGSSDAGLAAARVTGATAVQYPGPPDRCPVVTEERSLVGYGVRVGIIAREEEDQAWEVAHARFPVDRKGQITHQLAMKVSDSAWHRQLSSVQTEAGQRDTYWLVPFQNYKTFCPYLVGSHAQVAREIGRYIAAGYRAYILDIPPSEEELTHIGIVFRHAEERISS